MTRGARPANGRPGGHQKARHTDGLTDRYPSVENFPKVTALPHHMIDKRRKPSPSPSSLALTDGHPRTSGIIFYRGNDKNFARVSDEKRRARAEEKGKARAALQAGTGLQRSSVLGCWPCSGSKRNAAPIHWCVADLHHQVDRVRINILRLRGDAYVQKLNAKLKRDHLRANCITRSPFTSHLSWCANPQSGGVVHPSKSKR